MLPRNKNRFVFAAVFFVSVLMPFFFIAQAQSNPVFHFYEKVISPVDGDRCPMNPSCSQYAVQAIEKHGIVIGWVMACDRLQRCGRDTVALSKTVMVDHVPHAYDPVSENDFWWFEKERKNPAAP